MPDPDGVIFGLSAPQLGLLIMAPMIIGVGVLLRRKGGLSRGGLIAASAATLAMFAVMFFSQ